MKNPYTDWDTSRIIEKRDKVLINIRKLIMAGCSSNKLMHLENDVILLDEALEINWGRTPKERDESLITYHGEQNKGKC